MLGVAGLTGIVGFLTAWLVTFYDFWGRRWFQWMLLLPLAMPGYLLAYTYTDLLEYSGPIQSYLREVFGWGRRDYWFPEIRSLGGAITLLSLSLYPYVYLLTRASLLEQSSYLIEAGKLSGAVAAIVFSRIALPITRPALDRRHHSRLNGNLGRLRYRRLLRHRYLHYWDLPYLVWHASSRSSRLPFLYLAYFCCGTCLLERWQRKRRGYVQKSNASRAGRLRPSSSSLVHCSLLRFAPLPLFLGFILPIGLWLAAFFESNHFVNPLEQGKYILNSLTLASLGAVTVVVIATILAYCRRNPLPKWQSAAIRLASMGYAVPGSIIAVGILLPLAGFDNWLDAQMEHYFGISTGLLLTGSLFGLIFAYSIRFMAVAMNPLEASLQKISFS